tara:strand:+ start:324 stop:503 length:180 start_codon:yes stop_codon:yes gene_type:complete
LRQFLPNLENDKTPRLTKTFGRLKGRALSKNQKVGLEMLHTNYGFSLENNFSLEKKKFG